MRDRPGHCRSSPSRHIASGRSWVQDQEKLSHKGSSIQLEESHVPLSWAIYYLLLGQRTRSEAKLFLIKFGIFLCQYLFPRLPWYFCKILCNFPSLVIGRVWSQIPEPQFHQFSLPQDVWTQAHSGKQNTLFLRNGQVFNNYNLLTAGLLE